MQTTTYIPVEHIRDRILEIRDQKVLLDRDLALLYGVETKQLKRQVKRNSERFPEDFMFELTPEEMENLRCQNGTSSWGGTRHATMAFTEQGVAMLSSVIGSPVAIQVNIRIIRVFTHLRRLVADQEALIKKLEYLESRIDEHDEQLQAVFEGLRAFIQETPTERTPIGFKRSDQGKRSG